jgi:hypothetical protein
MVHLLRYIFEQRFKHKVLLNMRRKLLAYTLISSFILAMAASCSPNPYGAKNSAYYKSQARKYEVADRHVDCPLLVNPPSKRRKR